jgi:DNA-binding XRE family transcriptional regulator
VRVSLPHFGVSRIGVENRPVVAVSSSEYQSLLARLRQARLDAGLTQVEVAQRLGVRQTFVSKVELGERRLDPVELAQFAALYRRPLDWFLGIQGLK